MTLIKEQALRQFGDQGAETLQRYYAQIEYSAFWCARMLRAAEGIDAVIPEGVEDVVVVQHGVYRLYQVKTRDESQGPWTTADVLPILCQQYYRRIAFLPSECYYHFVSNQMADNKTTLRPGSYGALYRLKFLLDIKHAGQSLEPDEQTELHRLEEVLVPRIQEILVDQYMDNVDDVTALALLHNTWIETGCLTLHYPCVYEFASDNLAEIETALLDSFPGAPTLTMIQLRQMYGRLLLLVFGRIKTGKSLEARRIVQQDVLDCRATGYAPGDGYPNLDGVPGRTTLDKKARLGGFDPTELPVFHKQKQLAEWPIRGLGSLGLADNLTRLTAAILDLQRACRDKVCREQGVSQEPGPRILSMVRPGLASLSEKYFPGSKDVDDQFCQGVLWKETDLCSVWWHRFDNLFEGSQHGYQASR